MTRFASLFLLLGFLTLQYGCAQNQTANNPGTYQNIDLADFDRILQEQPNAVLLDVRTPEETAQGKMEGAVEVDFNAPDFEQNLKSLDKDATYIIYCRSGVRSEKTAKIMADQGYKSVYNFRGGFNAWKEAGR
jgi:rhodanese-related sulfurtransferase